MDDVPINATGGEYMIKASAVSRYGREMMDDINAGRAALHPRTDPAVARATEDAARGQVILIEEFRAMRRQQAARDNTIENLVSQVETIARRYSGFGGRG